MDNLSYTKSQRWKLRRGVSLEPLLPPFMWQRSRPPRTPAKSSTDLVELKEKKVRNEIRLAAVEKFAPTSNILLETRQVEDSIARSTVDFEVYDEKKVSEEMSEATKDSRDFRSTRTEEFAGESTDPVVSHAVWTSYERLPLPRYYRGDGTSLEYNPIQLAKRPRSPIRHVLPAKFDLEAAKGKLPNLSKKLSPGDQSESLEGQISDEMKNGVCNIPFEHGPATLPLVLKVILEELVLISACKSLGLEVQTFINVATTWALVELEAVELAKAFAKKLSESEALLNVRKLRCRVTEISKLGSFSARIARRRNPLLSFEGSTVHRSLPWDLLCPGHEAGICDGYRNVADCIDEKIPGARQDIERATRVPDLTCYHFFRDGIARRDKKEPRDRNFRRFRNAKSDTARIEEFLVQLVSFL